ncbi:hypothetical protein [Chthonobacter albigriseus]|uniref:hypothetical protein n=1 Tax=Chthonobacter albigriseus TaxID=1683161 RepID=UPI0015EF7A1C|nr:hypothetical protein [Chthonobacter albigriseus]
MHEIHLPPTVNAILARGTITPADVSRLRATVYGNAIVTPEEAEWAFCLDEGCAEKCPEWTQFFVEQVVDFVVHQARPEGYVTPSMADWLIKSVSRDGIVRTESELEVLVKVLDASVSAPAELSAFCLKQVATAVVDGAGPIAKGVLEPGVIGAAEVELLRRILFAFGGDGGIAISRAEAEVLFDLNDRTQEAANDPSWSDLFVKAVANFLMAARGYTVPSRQEALRREEWLDRPSGGVVGLFGDAMSGLLTHGLRGIWSSFRAPEETPQAARNREVEAEMRASAPVTADEVRWLADRIGRDGVIHQNERALLLFLREESPDIHPSLQTLLDTAA